MFDGAGVVEASTHPDIRPGERVVVNGWGLGETRWGCLAQRARLRIDSIPAGGWWTTPTMKAALGQSVQRYAIRRSPFHAHVAEQCAGSIPATGK